MSNRPIHYEPHPVSRERKAEIIAAGFRIIDAKFKPKDESVRFAIETSHGVADVAGFTEWTPLTGVIEDMPADEIKALLTGKGVKFRANASRATLLALLTKEA